MKAYLSKTPEIIQSLYKNYTWCFPTDKKELYLTFDDGPTPEVTQWVLDTLQKHQAKATFFCIGKNIENHPEIFKQLLADGHAVGNHSYNHLNGIKTSSKSYVEDVLLARKTMQQLDDTNGLQLFRPPYGRIKPSQGKKIRNLGYKIIMWNVLSADFDTSISNETCLQNVLKNAENGSDIVFHDSEKAKERLYYALPKILEYYRKKGFVFKKIS